ncbi:hypothetical protein K458DRAFT_460790 [Lentithecium fluviatile CBS 122367]|uniref:Uncharacterized protein n=1 Tax=Lentithecium fluviatile CBS 122367 TaxID=1168545 RepID=A0A6G1IC64_9PLEO|nr:hypothetical protein K458DRAFT_450537 [Lentithecium fluviatile CBS 122367]KAF2679611.1 hypothetical protein K458DRAFT_460790 [Lentithecium fluviatile CBS 122367]
MSSVCIPSCILVRLNSSRNARSCLGVAASARATSSFLLITNATRKFLLIKFSIQRRPRGSRSPFICSIWIAISQARACEGG